MDAASEEYEFELTVAEAAIRAVVQQSGAGRDTESVCSAVEEILAEPRIREATDRHLERRGATDDMASGLGTRLQKARDRRENQQVKRNTGVRVLCELDDPPRHDTVNSGVLAMDDLGTDMEAIVRKADHSGTNPPAYTSTYPLMNVDGYPICTCQDRHYNRRDGGTCYHELAYDLEKGRGSTGDRDEVTVRL